MIVTAASAATAGPHSVEIDGSATSNRRSSTPKAATLVATAMKAVIGVGAPW